MKKRTIRVLLVEDDPVAGGLMHSQLGSDFGTDFQVARAGSLRDTFLALERTRFDIVVLDLNLPDSNGLDTLRSVHAHADDVPIVVLSAIDDEELSLRAVEAGAQDYFVKGDLTGRTISRFIRHAIERHRMTEELRDLSLTDELTGLYNRRGFLSLAGQQLKVAQRLGRGVALIFADLDNFKQINDELGHAVGDRLLRWVAGLLRETFRQSDLVGRFGGDEFLVLTLQPSQIGVQAALKRLRANLGRKVLDEAPERRLSLSVGLEWLDSAEEIDLPELIERADRSLYRQKRARKWRLPVSA